MVTPVDLKLRYPGDSSTHPTGSLDGGTLYLHRHKLDDLFLTGTLTIEGVEGSIRSSSYRLTEVRFRLTGIIFRSLSPRRLYYTTVKSGPRTEPVPT